MRGKALKVLPVNFDLGLRKGTTPHLDFARTEFASPRVVVAEQSGWAVL
jgi:hypothetical protein